MMSQKELGDLSRQLKKIKKERTTERVKQRKRIQKAIERYLRSRRCKMLFRLADSLTLYGHFPKMKYGELCHISYIPITLDAPGMCLLLDNEVMLTKYGEENPEEPKLTQESYIKTCAYKIFEEQKERSVAEIVKYPFAKTEHWLVQLANGELANGELAKAAEAERQR